jgi:hypothetical protein
LLLLLYSNLTGHFPFVAGGDLVDPRLLLPGLLRPPRLLLPGLLRPPSSRKKKRE